MNSDEINYYGCGLSFINLKFCPQIVDSNRFNKSNYYGCGLTAIIMGVVQQLLLWVWLNSYYYGCGLTAIIVKVSMYSCT